MNADHHPPTPRARLLTILWFIGSLLPTVGLLVYFNFSTSTHSVLAQLSEEPHPYTAILGLGLAVSITVFLLSHRIGIPKVIRRKLRVGTAAALLGFGCYSFYVYSFSTLPPAPQAPQVGDTAPDFTVRDPEGRNWTLSELRGDVLVFFYRGHW